MLKIGILVGSLLSCALVSAQDVGRGHCIYPNSTASQMANGLKRFDILNKTAIVLPAAYLELTQELDQTPVYNSSLGKFERPEKTIKKEIDEDTVSLTIGSDRPPEKHVVHAKGFKRIIGKDLAVTELWVNVCLQRSRIFSRCIRNKLMLQGFQISGAGLLIKVTWSHSFPPNAQQIANLLRENGIILGVFAKETDKLCTPTADTEYYSELEVLTSEADV